MRRRRPATLTFVGIVLWVAPPVALAQPSWDSGSFDYDASDQGHVDPAEPPTGEPVGPAEETLEGEAAGFEDGSAPPLDEGEPAAVRAQLWAGLGLGSRSLRFPTVLEPASTDTGVHFALELGVELAFRRHPVRDFGLRADYQTSAGLDIEETRVATTPRTYSARSHQIRAGLFVRRKLGAKGALSGTFGYGARNFHSLVPDVQTPSFTLSGPLVALGLELRMASGRLWVRLEPEVSPILQVGDQVIQVGAGHVGIAGGGEVALGARLLDVLALELVYYESRARVGSGSSEVRDGLRFLTLRVRGEL